MLISQILPNELTPEQIFTLLYPGEPSDSELHGDCIMVFGNGSLDRADKAIRLYKHGRAPVILFSGGDKWGQRDNIEALSMKEYALEQGVPDDAILIETLSNNTKENVLASILVLDRALGLHKVRRIIDISDSGHLRRCLLTLKTYMPDWINFVMVGTGAKIPDNWWEIKPLRERAIKEIEGLIYYINDGQLIDAKVHFRKNIQGWLGHLITTCSRFGANAPRSPEDKSMKQILATHPHRLTASRSLPLVA